MLTISVIPVACGGPYWVVLVVFPFDLSPLDGPEVLRGKALLRNDDVGYFGIGEWGLLCPDIGTRVNLRPLIRFILFFSKVSVTC